MEWYEEEEGRKPNFGVQVRYLIDRSLCAIDRTEDMPQLSESYSLSDRSDNLCDRSDRGKIAANWELFSVDRSDLLSDRSEGVGSLDMTILNLRNL
eukprot:TRINITY_DN37004_c2_g1_i3.p1 TRINITY_DN37004_c2_g1~~TRINITY_DN37004_c2_g1_i3.p1  ORF type:complete len:105 (+),score=7.62 TRINITY_DN37004_c2_g1_i3:29-316(+)